MKCETCGRCTALKEKNGVYEIACLEKGGFNLHKDYEDNFNCEDWIERKEPEIPPKDNVLIILKCGRDMVVYDKSVSCLEDIRNKLEKSYDLGGGINFAMFGNIMFQIDEIACWGYIGD